MKAMRFAHYGGPEVMILEELPALEPGPGEVVVEVHACALNHVDLDIRSGVSRLPVPLPHTLGLEFAGVVSEAGSEVDASWIGQRVTALHQVHCGKCQWCLRGEEESCSDTRLFGVHIAGGYATHVLVPERALIRIPDSLSFDDAAASQTTFSTAWHALRSRANLLPGETVLVNAAGSGVGVAAIQLAQLLGGRVIVSAGSDDKMNAALEMGAVGGVNYRTSDLASGVLELTDGRGVDVVMESVGGNVLKGGLEALAQNGRLVTVGAHAGEVVPVDVIVLFRKQLSLLGSVRANKAEIEHVLTLVGAGSVKPRIHRRFPLSGAREAHAVLAERSNLGKVILDPTH